MDVKVNKATLSAGDRLGWCVWVALLGATVVSPWFFGAWEMWWFWPFAVAIAMGVALAGMRLTMAGCAGAWCGDDARRDALRCGLLALPFLGYAVWRWHLTPVFMDAERAVLLQVTGVVVAALVVFGMGAKPRRLLFAALFASLLAMALYGVLNHLVLGSRHVLWMPRYEQYAGRATGPYYCPDHFAGAMELLLCMSAGLLLDRAPRGPRIRWVAALAGALAATGVLLSQSRGAGMTLGVMGVCMMCWGFLQWPPRIRWYWRVAYASVALLAVMAGLRAFPVYVDRFVTYGELNQVRRGGETPVVEEVLQRLSRTSRGRMYGAAWRAWRSAPWTGIGPGMHQHFWPRFAATPDGDAERGIWPTLTNEAFHSYEVHSDWLQLLEEYGVIGFVLFLVPVAGLGITLRRRLREESRAWRNAPSGPEFQGRFAYLLCGMLALAAMAFHSLGDFNLQMPGTVWMLAALLGFALAEMPPVLRSRRRARRRVEGPGVGDQGAA